MILQLQHFLEESVTSLDEVSDANITINVNNQNPAVVADIYLTDAANLPEEKEKSIKLLILKSVKDISEENISLSITNSSQSSIEESSVQT